MSGTISEPPKFPTEAYEEFRRNLRFWKEINGYFDEWHLVAKLAMRAEGSLKTLIIRYIKEVKNAESRKVEDIINMMDAEFARPTQEVVITKNKLLHEHGSKARRRHQVILGQIRQSPDCRGTDGHHSSGYGAIQQSDQFPKAK